MVILWEVESCEEKLIGSTFIDIESSLRKLSEEQKLIDEQSNKE